MPFRHRDIGVDLQNTAVAALPQIGAERGIGTQCLDPVGGSDGERSRLGSIFLSDAGLAAEFFHRGREKEMFVSGRSARIALKQFPEGAVDCTSNLGPHGRKLYSKAGRLGNPTIALHSQKEPFEVPECRIYPDYYDRR
ncbi:hypothetical protein [Streptomyces sp. CA-132043]|uniref:hypothetical protein n=1 Tax=Streptomyces sp. CA-132043 TaxID=3240048 RepID=UPI003D8F90D7